jgi:VanZ family protein
VTGPSGAYVQAFGHAPSVLGTIAIGVLLALVAAAASRSRRVLTALTGCSLALVLGVTVVPSGGWSGFAVGDHVLGSILGNVRPEPGDLTAWQHAADGPLNVVLFVPLGFFLALLLRRPVAATVGCAAVSLVIECYQASLTTRVGTFADVVANGLGAGIGGVLAVLLLAAVPSAARPFLLRLDQGGRRSGPR